ncbi:MAG TPA: arsenate reductase ArsC [Dongiaceae bacterium]|nr:arsenate reductase ArsC [Dongiaceae bacterium]
MERKIRVLFVCIHNSARSQMAEALLKKIGGERFEARSAGLEPGTLNPLAVEVMKEEGTDISANQTRSVFDLLKGDAVFDYVVTVCDGASAEKCPVFPGTAGRLNWSFEDPAATEGSHEEKLEKTRRIRDQIRTAVEGFVKQTAP